MTLRMSRSSQQGRRPESSRSPGQFRRTRPPPGRHALRLRVAGPAGVGAPPRPPSRVDEARRTQSPVASALQVSLELARGYPKRPPLLVREPHRADVAIRDRPVDRAHAHSEAGAASAGSGVPESRPSPSVGPRSDRGDPPQLLLQVGAAGLSFLSSGFVARGDDGLGRFAHVAKLCGHLQPRFLVPHQPTVSTPSPRSKSRSRRCALR
jgi:hypothetical protein